MKYIHKIWKFICICGILTLPYKVYAQDYIAEAGQSAMLIKEIPAKIKDTRGERLGKFLISVHSPMATSAYHIVREADRLGLDWKLIPAIAGNESYFGNHIPFNSYNGWGWGVWTGRSYGMQFTNWNDGITKVSEGLKYNYINKGLTSIDLIGKRYAADPLWSWKVRHFMNLIDAFDSYQKDERLLALSF